MVDSEGQSPMRKRAISTASVADSQKDLSPARRLMTGSREAPCLRRFAARVGILTPHGVRLTTESTSLKRWGVLEHGGGGQQRDLDLQKFWGLY